MSKRHLPYSNIPLNPTVSRKAVSMMVSSVYLQINGNQRQQKLIVYFIDFILPPPPR